MSNMVLLQSQPTMMFLILSYINIIFFTDTAIPKLEDNNLTRAGGNYLKWASLVQIVKSNTALYYFLPDLLNPHYNKTKYLILKMTFQIRFWKTMKQKKYTIGSQCLCIFKEVITPLIVFQVLWHKHYFHEWKGAVSVQMISTLK